MKNSNYWNQRYQTGKTGWNIGHISTPIKAYIDQLKDKDKSLKILIPGSGNSYEAEYIFKQGFKHIYVADIAPLPLKNLAERVPEFPKSHLLNIDFFKIEDQFDLIIEQTFFCALEPELREDYAKQMAKLLKPEGKLVGLLFDFPLTIEGPPYGGSEEEYRQLFSDLFDIDILEKSYNSILPRKGKELFFKAVNHNK